MLARLMPGRTQYESGVKIICDFDAALTEPVAVKFQGKIHKLLPVDVENFMKVTVAYRDLLEMLTHRAEGSELSEQDVFERYYNLIHPLVPSISYAEIRAMNLVMLNNLIHLVFRQIAGDPSLYEKQDEKKNP